MIFGSGKVPVRYPTTLKTHETFVIIKGLGIYSHSKIRKKMCPRSRWLADSMFLRLLANCGVRFGLQNRGTTGSTSSSILDRFLGGPRGVSNGTMRGVGLPPGCIQGYILNRRFIFDFQGTEGTREPRNRGSLFCSHTPLGQRPGELFRRCVDLV